MTSFKDQAIQTALTGDWEKAISINKLLIKENPTDIDALNRLAFAFSILGRTKDAVSTYQKVLKIDSLNPLALQNLKRIGDLKTIKNNNRKNSATSLMYVNNMFIEEQGKTKIVELVNVAQPSLINALRSGQALNLSVKRLKIFVLSEGKQYIGVLPDNIGKRLIKFIKAGALYDAYVKSASTHKVNIFIKEVKRAKRYKDQPSFLSNSETALLVKNPKRADKDEDGQETESYLEE